MFFVSEPMTTAPTAIQTPLQEKTYQALDALHIPFQRVDTDEAITMEDCVQIDAKLDMKMVKTLFLCNRQHTNFYLFITTGDKPFRSKEFSKALGVARVSFAPAEQIVFDQDVLAQEWYGCSDGTTTCYLKVRTEQILHQLLPYANHAATVIAL